jgi:dipeptidyl aminopeptidase/acylaminoacyl peptidase
MNARKLRNYVLIGILTALATSFSPAAESGSMAKEEPAKGGSSGYDKPPKHILDVMRAPAPPLPVVSPTLDTILLVSWEDYPSIERVATPFLRLAGVRVETKNHSRHDTRGGYGITRRARGFELVRVADGAQTPVTLREGMCAGAPLWSTDGMQFAFVNIAAESVELWIGEAKTGKTRQILGVRLNPMLNDDIHWIPGQRKLFVKLVPKDLGAPPAGHAVPSGPSIQETGGTSGQSSTYEARDTLNSKEDEDVFDFYAVSQLGLVDADSGAITQIGRPGNYESLDLAPDGRHILVTRIHRPYSYVVTYERFPRDVEVWDITDPVSIGSHTIASLPLADRVPIHGVPLGAREFGWRATEPATLIWAEALDGGDWNVNAPARDKILLQKAPFTSPAVEIARTEQRFAGFDWCEQANTALLNQEDLNRHWRKTHIVDIDNPAQKPRLLWDLSTDEHYGDPGSPVRRQLPSGAWVVRQDGDSIYLEGGGASPEGDRPFLDRLNLNTQKSERLFRCERNCYEFFLSFTGSEPRRFLTWHQSPVDPPNVFTRTLAQTQGAPAGEAVFASTNAALTHIPDATPEVRAIQKRLVKYHRDDGLDLSFTLYTPAGYKEGTRVPAILYAYPLDYADASKAGQVVGSQQTFTRLRNYRLLLLAGYAIMDDVSFPIVGDPKKAYDTYLEQLVSDAKAAVDEAVRLGVADRERIGVTGHSHGAMMTANLVAHSDLFRAGVATSGAYNKVLTPFGFQNERRSVWEARDVYLKVSPYFYADKLKTPLLIVHGEEDANPGTTPLQAKTLYEAIRGNGGTARLVMLPHEPHWYSAMESNEQLIYEMLRWFNKYVKDAPRR